MIRLFLSLLILAQLASSCKGLNQAEAPLASPLSVAIQDSTAYGPADVVTQAFLDSNGDMWFSTTDEGVFHYDGIDFTRYTLEDGLCGNEVWAIMEDQEGMMWFGTGKGLCKFDGESFETISLPKDDATSEWMDRMYPHVNPTAVSSLIQDRNGIFWIGSNGAGAYRYDGKTFTSFLKERGNRMPDSLRHNVIVSILEDRDGNIWFSSFSHGGVSKFDGTEFTHYGPEEGLGDDMIASSYLDTSGKVWIGTRGGGMSYWDTDSFVSIHQPEGACHNNMATLLEDRKGRLWVASYARSGVCWYDGESFIPFEIEHSEKLIDIKCLAEDRDGNIWFGGRYGILWRYDGEKLEDFTQVKRR